jgi:hypothetical protein
MDAMTTMFAEIKAKMEAVIKQNEALQKRVVELETNDESEWPAEKGVIPLLTWVLYNVRPEGDLVTAALLRTLITAAPDLFEVYGTLHTDKTGSKTYYSVRLWNDDTKKHFIPIHIYVTLRHGKTHIIGIDIMYYHQTSKLLYPRRPQSVEGSVE